MNPRDFSKYSRFPGTESSYTDIFNGIANRLEGLPGPVFAILLFAIAVVWFRVDPFVVPDHALPLALVLSLFFAGDWLLLALLPRAGRSFGPPKPPALILALFRLLPAWLPLPWNLVLQGVGTLLVVYGFWIEPHRIRTTHQVLRTPKLDGARPLSILQLSDLHLERTTARERQLVDLVHTLEPDLIVFAGDFLNLSYIDDPVTHEQTRALLRELRAPLGVYAVSGSPAVDTPETTAALLDGLDIRRLNNERITVDHQGSHLDVIGLDCSHKPFDDVKQLDAVLDGADRPFTLLLYHSPDLAPEAARRGIDLQLSGHTHGGQIRFPFIGALYTGSLYGKRLEVGRYQIGEMTLYIGRGIGMEGKGAPRVRFLCPPEVVFWHVAGTGGADARV